MYFENKINLPPLARCCRRRELSGELLMIGELLSGTRGTDEGWPRETRCYTLHAQLCLYFLTPGSHCRIVQYLFFNLSSILADGLVRDLHIYIHKIKTYFFESLFRELLSAFDPDVSPAKEFAS